MIVYVNISGCAFDKHYQYTVATCQKKLWKWILKNQISMVFIFSLCVRLSQFPGKALSPNDYSKISHVQFLPKQETSLGFGELLKYVWNIFKANIKLYENIEHYYTHARLEGF